MVLSTSDSNEQAESSSDGGRTIGNATTDLISFYGVAPVAQPAVANLTGTITGSANGTMEDVPAVTAAGGEATAAELTATNTAITAINLQNKELFTKVNEVVDKLQLLGIFG